MIYFVQSATTRNIQIALREEVTDPHAVLLAELPGDERLRALLHEKFESVLAAGGPRDSEKRFQPAPELLLFITEVASGAKPRIAANVSCSAPPRAHEAAQNMISKVDLLAWCNKQIDEAKGRCGRFEDNVGSSEDGVQAAVCLVRWAVILRERRRLLAFIEEWNA